MSLETTSLEELSLLECLIAIDHNEELSERSWVLRDRLIESGMVAQHDGRLTLTSAGVERCRSLQHRVAADREAAKVIAAREASEESDPNAHSPRTETESSTTHGPTQ